MDSMPDIASLSSAIGEMMKNPDFARTVEELKAKLASSDTPISEANPASAKAESVAIPNDIMGKLPSIIESLGGKNGIGSQAKDMARLLGALKPFLSGRRREAIDSIVTIAEIGSAFGLMPKKE